MSFKSFLNNIWRFFRNLWNSVESYVQDNVHAAVIVTEGFKKIVDSPLTDIATTLIPGTLDDKIVKALRMALPKVLVTLNIVDECIDIENEQERIKCFAEKLSKVSDELKDVFYHGLAVTIAKELSDGNVSFSDAIALVEWYYRNKVKK